MKRKSTKKTISKLCSYLLTAAMVVTGLTLSPMTTVKVQAAATTKNVNLNTGSGTIAGIKKGQDALGSKIYFGSERTPILWRVMSTDKPATDATGTVTLLADGAVDTRAYDPYAHYKWSGSDICAWLNGGTRSVSDGSGNSDYSTSGFLPTQFTDVEKAAMESEYSNIVEQGYKSSDTYTPNQTVVLPSVTEADSWFSSDNNRKLSDWWRLRSPGSENFCAAYVDENGSVNSGGRDVDSSYGVRPAFNLNLEKVLFTSASGAKNSDFKETSDSSSNEWVLTLSDKNTGFTASRNGTGDVKKGEKVSLINIGNYTTTDGVKSTQISAMLVQDDTVYAYGKIADVTATTADITIPNKDEISVGNYTLKVFSERANTGNVTSYASNMIDIPIKIVEGATPSTPSTPSSSGDNSESHSDSAAENKGSSDSTEEAYVNPLVWYYEANQAGSQCLIEHQGKACVAAFKEATPKGYREAFSFNLLLKDNGFFKPAFVKKTGKFVLNIPTQWQKPGRTFAVIGIGKNGKTKLFTDEDKSDETFTTTLNIEGYAFSLIYIDTAGAAPKESKPTSGTGGVYIVQAGDTLSEIAQKLGKTRKHLIEANDLENPNKLVIGQKLNY